MNEPLQRFLTPHLQRWLGFVSQHARQVSASCILATLAALDYSFFNPGTNPDHPSPIYDRTESR